MLKAERPFKNFIDDGLGQVHHLGFFFADEIVDFVGAYFEAAAEKAVPDVFRLNLGLTKIPQSLQAAVPTLVLPDLLLKLILTTQQLRISILNKSDNIMLAKTRYDVLVNALFL